VLATMPTAFGVGERLHGAPEVHSSGKETRGCGSMRHDATTVSYLPVVLEPRREGMMVKGAWVRERQHKENKMKFWNLTALTMTLAMVAAAPDSAHSQNSAVKGPTRTVTLTGQSLENVYGPPGGQVSIFSAGSLQGNFLVNFPDNMIYRVHNLACRTGWYTANTSLEDAASEFYVIYLTIWTAEPQIIRVQTFNTGCPAGGGPGFAGNGSYSNFAYLGSDSFVPGDELEGLFTEKITIDIFLERDDGEPLPPDAEPVLSGTDLAPN
jgi:hypothetical protein